MASSFSKAGVRAVSLLGDRNYDQHIRRFNAYLTQHDLCVCEESILAYWRLLLRSGFAPRTLNLKRAAIRKGIRKTFQQKFDSRLQSAAFDQFFSEEIKALRIDNSVNQEKQLSDADIAALLRGLPRWLGQIFSALVYTGLRITELRTLSFRRAEQGEDHWKFEVRGKGGRVRAIYLPLELVVNIQSTFGVSDLLFPNQKGKIYSRQYLDRELRLHGQRLLGKNVHFHQARHYFALSQRKAGHAIEKISRYLGHSSVATSLDMYCASTLALTELPLFPVRGSSPRNKPRRSDTS